MSLAWGGFANGRIPASALHPVPQFKPLGTGWATTEHGSNLMRTAGAIQLSAMQRAFFRRFNVRLYAREVYRNWDGQDFYRTRYEKRLPGWTLAAVRGTSIHGWALSVDLGVGETNENPSGEYLAWLREYAATYGFRNDVPSEVWHWSFLLAPTSGVTTYIDNPSAAPADTTPTEDEMDVRLIRNNTKGSKRYGEVHAISVSAGWSRHLGPGYAEAWEKAYGIKTEELESKPDSDWFGYWLQMCTQTRDEMTKAVLDRVADTIVDKVWAEPITAKENGKQPASARLAGADLGRNLSDAMLDKIADRVAAKLPASSGGVVNTTVDPAAIAKALAPLVTPAVVKAVGDDLSKRLQA